MESLVRLNALLSLKQIRLNKTWFADGAYPYLPHD